MPSQYTLKVYEDEISRLHAEVTVAQDGEMELAGRLAAVEMQLTSSLRRAGEAASLSGVYIYMCHDSGGL